MPDVTFALSDDQYQKLETVAAGEERTPEAQAKILVLEALKLRPMSMVKAAAKGHAPRAKVMTPATVSTDGSSGARTT